MPPIVTDTWNTVFFQPMLNGLILLYSFLFNNFGLTVIVFTVLVRMVILPLTLRQLHAAKAMSRLQPEMAKLQKRYGSDKQKISQEQMRLYKEHGVNPLGCAVPTLVQFPVWIGLYQSILLALAATPESLMRLSSHLYPNLTVVHELVPLENHFLWLDLAVPDSLFRQLFGLPIDLGPLPLLVAGSMWIQQKMSTIPSEDPRQKQMNPDHAVDDAHDVWVYDGVLCQRSGTVLVSFKRHQCCCSIFCDGLGIPHLVYSRPGSPSHRSYRSRS